VGSLEGGAVKLQTEISIVIETLTDRIETKRTIVLDDPLAQILAAAAGSAMEAILDHLDALP
jgi:hypothetical protein